MYPIIFQLGPITIYSYGVMIALAYLAGIYAARREAIRKNIKLDLVYDLAFYLVIGSLIGARVYYVALFDASSFTKDPVSLFKIWEGGLAIHGAILGGIITGILFSKLHRVSFWKLADLIAPSIILGQAIGRIGCFLNGCCFGVPTQSIFGIHFPEKSPAHIAYPAAAIHPTQLYELILNLIGFFILWSIRRKIKPEGRLFLLYLLIYSSIRILVSFLRGDSVYIWDGLGIAQVVSAVIFVIALGIFIKRKKSA